MKWVHLGLAAAGTATFPSIVLAAAPVSAQQPSFQLDHIVVAVEDLAGASENFRSMGFAPKDGRLHPNGLINQHLEFEDGTEIELMTLDGRPGDDIARGYSEFLEENGDGGAFLALRGTQAEVLEAASRAGIDTETLASGGFRYVTFPSHDLAAVFTVEYPPGGDDPTPPSTHPNSATGISTVWIEGSEALVDLLVAMGAVPGGDLPLPDGRSGPALEIDGKTIAVVPVSGGRPRVVGVAVESESANGSWLPVEAHGIWLTRLAR